MSMTNDLPVSWKSAPIFDVAPIVSKLVDPRIAPYNNMILIAPDHVKSETGRLIKRVSAREQNVISGKYLVQQGDVIYSKIRPYLRKVLLAEETCLCSADMYPLHCSRLIAPDFLKIVLLGSRFTSYANSCSARTGIPKLNRDDMGAFHVPLPPINEQKAITNLLSTWDEAIDKTERLIQAKERRFQWLLRDTMSDSAKGNINNGRKKVAIGSFLTESRIPDTVNDPNKRLTVRLHLKGVEARDVRGTESSDATAYFIRKSGQLVYGKQNIFRGAVGIIPPELDGYASTQDIPAFYIDNTVDQDWLLFLFSYPGFYKKLEIYASGSGSKRLHSKDLFKIHISIPNLEAQKKLADGLSLARSEIDFLKDLTDRYKSQKRGLMQKLLTGQWRVRVDKEVA